ncbi:MAG: DUF1080 domain-containing protein [Planctomycetota bacterium]|nr:DUF1080 domain-containing protein [Planctomycetota bacterium]
MKICVAICLIAISSSVCLGDKNTDISPTLAKPGEVVLSDSFDGETLGKEWAATKGEWKIKDGALVAKELKADEHAAVLTCKLKNRDSIVRFSFKLNGSTKSFNLSLNHAQGHLFRVTIAPTGLTIRTDKDKKDESIKSELIAEANAKFEQDTWYTLQVEMVGDQVVAMTDNGLKVSGQHPRLDTEKPNYRFVMRGETLSIDDLKIWAAK